MDVSALRGSLAITDEILEVMQASIQMHVDEEVCSPAGFWSRQFVKALDEYLQWMEANGKAPLHTADDEKAR